MFKLGSIIPYIKNNKYLVLILLVATLLRFGGTNPGYSAYHSDEPAIYGSALEMVKNSTLDPGRYDYPAPAILINVLFYKFLFIPISWVWYYFSHFWDVVDGVIKIPPVKEEAKRIFTLYIAGQRGINAMLWARYVTALFSLGNVFLIYILGKNLWRREVGLIAAFFLAFNFRHVLNSHIALPDIYNSFFLLLSLVTTFNLWKFPARRNYLFAGIAAGLSFSTKYQVYAFLPLALIHLYLSFVNGRFKLSRFLSPYAIAAALTIPIVFMLINPYYLINIEQALKSNLDDFRKYGIGTNNLNLFPLSYIYHIDFGPPLFLTSLLGVIFMMRDWRKLLFLCSALIYFFFVFIYYSRGGFYVRNIIPATPIFLLFASYAIWEVVELIKAKAKFRFIPTILTLLLFFLASISAKNSIINSYYYMKERNYDAMARWLRENLPPNSIVAATPFDVPGGPKMKKTEFELDGNFSLAEHRETGADWALMNLDWASGNFYFWMNIDLDNLSYWNKPLDIMRNSYHGLAAEELFRYQVHSVTKPWQAPDANLILAKIPKWPEVKTRKIAAYNFDKEKQGWQIYPKITDGLLDYQFDPGVGHTQSGSLMFLPGSSKSRTTRIASPSINVREGYLYKINGYLKTREVLQPREREGFLRVDFYSEAASSEEIGKISSVSSRVYGTDEWVRKEMVERAPAGSRYLVVSFQTHSTIKTKIWLDDVELYESEEAVEDITAKPPYQYRLIDLNNLYPFSHGNL